jgi:hypothetical protein
MGRWILKPEYVLLAPVEEGDMVIWDEYGVFHSAVDYPLEWRHSAVSFSVLHEYNVCSDRTITDRFYNIEKNVLIVMICKATRG